MKALIYKGITLAITIMMFTGAGFAQQSGYLAQKLMIENNLRERIKDALEKVIDNRKYVVDVSVDLELSTAIEEQTKYSPAGSRDQFSDRVAELNESSRSGVLSRAPISTGGVPIPGFDFDRADGSSPEISTGGGDDSESSEKPSDHIISRTYTEKRPVVSSVRNMDISIILQEGAAPELIENIRQVVMVASRFNRARGDILSIMTASFKERRDEKSAEQVLLKNIAEKLESLETQRERLGQVDWKQELENYKQDESERREEDRLYFQSKLAELERNARDRAFNQEKADMLRGDSIRLEALNADIQNLKEFLGTANGTDSLASQTQLSVQEKIREKNNLDFQIAEKLAMLETVQADLDRQYNGGSGNTALVVIGSILAALVIILLVVLVMVMMNKSKEPMMPPPWAYPPRRKKKSRPESTVTNEAKAAAPVPAPGPEPVSPESIAVLQSEVNDMKQAVVSMSVGQPTAATRIVKEWIQEEAPAQPEPAAPEPAPDEDSGKKKKKKKKK